MLKIINEKLINFYNKMNKKNKSLKQKKSRKVVFKKSNKKNNNERNSLLKRSKKITPRYMTPLDSLYALVQKKDLKVSFIMKKFSISKEEALNWSNVLENNNLIEVSYPFIGEPVLKIKSNSS
jgi:hypothetical protein